MKPVEAVVIALDSYNNTFGNNLKAQWQRLVALTEASLEDLGFTPDNASIDVEEYSFLEIHLEDDLLSFDDAVALKTLLEQKFRISLFQFNSEYDDGEEDNEFGAFIAISG